MSDCDHSVGIEFDYANTNRETESGIRKFVADWPARRVQLAASQHGPNRVQATKTAQQASEGWLERFTFCPDCGARIDWASIFSEPA